MARIVLVTGGCRSGKSGHAQRLAESLPGLPRRVFLATCPVIDDEMRDRVRRHQAARAAKDWTTVESPVELAEAVAGAEDFDVVLIDCLTLWVNNLMYQAELAGGQIDEEQLAARCEELVATCRARPGRTVIMVTNEVGMGIVPDNALARRYRDLVGRCNQVIAAAADLVTLVCCGIPLNLKGA